jgi:hypothetical protein
MKAYLRLGCSSVPNYFCNILTSHRNNDAENSQQFLYQIHENNKNTLDFVSQRLHLLLAHLPWALDPHLIHFPNHLENIPAVVCRSSTVEPERTNQSLPCLGPIT